MQAILQIFLFSFLENCGFSAVATEEDNFITSPNWPGQYGNDHYCEWTITTDENSRIEVLIENFSIEATWDFLVRGTDAIKTAIKI